VSYFRCPATSTLNHYQPGFPSCWPMDVERPARQYDICRVIIQLLSVMTQNSSIHEALYRLFPGLNSIYNLSLADPVIVCII